MWSTALGAVSNAYRYLSSRVVSRTTQSTLLPLTARTMTTSTTSQTAALTPYHHAAQAQFTLPPNPEWAFGQPVYATPDGRAWMEGVKEGWKVVDAETEDPTVMYKLMISGIVPRPIAFVSSVSADGIENLAPFSWFNMVTCSPPVVSIGILHHPDAARGLKDTAANILATKGFTVNLISEPFVHNANACSVDAPLDVSEWDLSGLTRAPSIHVAAPRVLESAFALECTLLSSHEIAQPATGAVTTTLILGLVKAVHVRRDMLTSRGLVDPARLRAVGKMGDITYARQGAMFRIPRPNWTPEMLREAAFHPPLKSVGDEGEGPELKSRE